MHANKKSKPSVDKYRSVSYEKKNNCQLCVPVLAEEEGEQGVLVHGRDNRIRQHSEGLEL